MSTPTRVCAAAEEHPRVSLGRTVMTRGVRALVEAGSLNPLSYLHRHQSGDWGDLCDDDTRLNNAALKHGDRLMSSYKVSEALTLWIITECDRSVTTLLLPSEY